MDKLTCEMCGSTDLMKTDGVFVCQTCGTKYSVEEAKRMMVEGTVEASNMANIENLLKLANSAYDSKNYKDMFYKVLEIYYKYNKYLIIINEVISLENELLLKKIEENLNAFFNAKNIDDILYILCLDFYKYLYSSNLDKDKIDIYYENMKKRGKVKLFSNKKRGSNP